MYVYTTIYLYTYANIYVYIYTQRGRARDVGMNDCVCVRVDGYE